MILQKDNDSMASSSFSINYLSKHIGNYQLSCVNIHYNFAAPSYDCFPSLGFIVFNFMTGTNFKQSFVTHDIPDSKMHHLYISGLLSDKPVVIKQTGNGMLYAIKFHPVVVYYLLKEKMESTTDNHHLISDIIGREASFLRKLEREQEIDSFDNQHLEKFLRKNLPDAYTLQRDPIYHAVNKIIQKKGMIRIKELASQFFMSERTLNRQFLLKVGLSPKAYAKIWQWYHVSEILQLHPGMGMQELAFRAGYYDVAHLIHDFKTKASLTPVQFQKDMDPLIKEYLRFAVQEE